MAKHPQKPWAFHGAVALLSAGVLLLQLTQIRVFSFMLWHHLTYLVITFTLLGFASGGALLACREKWTQGDCKTRFAISATSFGVLICATFWFLTDRAPPSSHTTASILRAAFDYGLSVLPMGAAGFALSLALAGSPSRGATYASNLIGSAMGCVLYLALLTTLGGEGALVLSAALGLSSATAALYSGGRHRLAIALLVLTVLASAVSIHHPRLLFEVRASPSKTMVQMMEHDSSLVIEETRWDPVCRIDALGPGKHLSANRHFFQDGDSPTVVPAGPVETLADPYAKEGLAYHLFPKTPPKVLAIGIGGGIDIIASRAERGYGDRHAVPFTGVELNPAIAELMRHEYREHVHDRYDLPLVDIQVDEGRAWLQRSSERFDIIQMTGTDTYAALSCGSYVMSESYLYTLEAFEDYFDHLSDRGILSIWRLRFEPPRESLRLVALAVEALEKRGLQRPDDHVVVLGVDGPKVNVSGESVGLDFCALFVRPSGFSAENLEIFARYAELEPSTTILHAPKSMRVVQEAARKEGAIQDFFDSRDRGEETEFRHRYPYDISAPTDDRPFFFRYHRWSNLWSDSKDDDTDHHPPFDYLNILGDKPVGLILLLTVLGQSTAIILFLVLLPLWIFRRQDLAILSWGHHLLFFTGLGLGYMLVEVVTMQRFVLVLGHPGWSVPIILATFLLFSGLGAWTAGLLHQRFSSPRAIAILSLVGILILLLAVKWGLDAVLYRSLSSSFPTRVIMSCALLAPLAYLMGFPFAMGLEILARNASRSIPWAFAVNGGASVFASVVGIIVAMEAGFSLVFLLAIAAYALALFSVVRTRSASPT